MNANILIVEDHLETRELLRAATEDAGYSVTCAGDIKGATEYLKPANRHCLSWT